MSPDNQDVAYANAMKQYMSNQSNAKETLDTFCKPIEAQYISTEDNDDCEGDLWELWNSIVSTAKSTPHDNKDQQERLVDLLVDLRERQVLGKDGQQVMCDEGQPYWQSLPQFGWLMRDSWNFQSSDDNDVEVNQKWINLNAFAATMTAVGHSKSAEILLSYSLYAIWAIREGLEEEEKPYNVDVSAAAVWFIYASSTMWDLCEKAKKFDGKMGKPGSLFEDKNWRGFTKERWQSWVQRFADLESHITDGQTKELVEKAQKAMAEAAQK